MLQYKNGFTLIELLVVLMIISIAVGLTAPVAYRSVNRFDNLVKKKEIVNLKKEAKFLSFIKNKACRVNKNLIVCDNDTEYKNLKDAFYK